MTATSTLPTSVALWRLARPQGMPLVMSLPLFGFGFAHWEWALNLRNPVGLACVLASWWFLSAGTLWLNAVLDRDEGDVLMGIPTPVPPGTSRWAYGALGGAVVLAALAGPIPGAAALGCALLSVLYSHPATAAKAHPVIGPGINIVGYGILSPLAGWALVGVPPTARGAATLVLSAVWIAGTYFGAQAFQQVEDTARGYRTLVATHGPRIVIRWVRLLYGTAFWGAMVLAGIGMYPRTLLVVIPTWFALDRHLARWERQPGGGDLQWGQQMLLRAATLVVVLLLATTVQHVWFVLSGGPPAGLGTAWQAPWAISP